MKLAGTQKPEQNFIRSKSRTEIAASDGAAKMPDTIGRSSRPWDRIASASRITSTTVTRATQVRSSFSYSRAIKEPPTKITETEKQLFTPIHIGPFALARRAAMAPLICLRSEQPGDIPGASGSGLEQRSGVHIRGAICRQRAAYVQGQYRGHLRTR